MAFQVSGHENIKYNLSNVMKFNLYQETYYSSFIFSLIKLWNYKNFENRRYITLTYITRSIMKIICYFSSAGGYVFQACTSNTYSLKNMIIFALDVSQKSSLVIDTVLHVYNFKAFPKTRLRSFLHLFRSLFMICR